MNTMKNTAAANGKLRKFGMMDKLAYAAGDFGCNCSFFLKGYLTLFWTQYMGINSYVLAGLLVVVQIWDAINDPLLGAIIDADQHKYRRNKFLTYISVGSVGLIAGGALCFLPLPNAPDMAKNILFVGGYMIWDAFYTIVNVPYGSLLSLVTKEPGERAQLSTWRSAGTYAAYIPIAAILPALIYDKSNNLRGDKLVWFVLALGFLGFIAFQFLVRNTVIRVDSAEQKSAEKTKFNPIKAVKNYCSNRAAMGVAVACFAEIIIYYGASTASAVMFQAYFKNAQISGVLSLIGMFGMFVFMPFIGTIVDKIGKKEAVAAGALFSLAAYVLMLVLPITPDGRGIAIFAVCQAMATLGYGLYNCLLYSLVADAIDYGEYRFGQRDEGTNYAMFSFFRKLAQSICPSLSLVIATVLGYDAALGAAQTESTARSMRYLVAGTYAFGAVLMLLGIAVIYNLDKKTLSGIEQELNERRTVG